MVIDDALHKNSGVSHIQAAVNILLLLTAGEAANFRKVRQLSLGFASEVVMCLHLPSCLCHNNEACTE